LPNSDARHPDSHIAHHDPRDVIMAPYLLELANRPDILGLAGKFLGCRPTISYLASWWSYPTTIGPQQAEHFHRDVDDWRFLKLFVYLTDVGPDDGPHVYVRHSASSPRLRTIRRFTDDEVARTFGPQAMLALTGRAGEGFLENTFGLHKGMPVTRGQRLIFQAVYSMFPLPYAPKLPVADASAIRLPNGAADPWINRLYLRPR
jgi:hypothetical protein